MDLFSKQEIEYCSCGSADCWDSEEIDILYKRANVFNNRAYLGSFLNAFKLMKINSADEFSVSEPYDSECVMHFLSTEKPDKFKCLVYDHETYSLDRYIYNIGYIYIYKLGKKYVFRFEQNPNEEESKKYNAQYIKQFITKSFVK